MTIQLPKDKELAVHMINGEQAQKQLGMKMGWVGKVFGGGEEKAGNIAGVVLIASLVAVLFLLFLWALYPDARLSEAITSFFGVITTTVGYIFGRNSKNDA